MDGNSRCSPLVLSAPTRQPAPLGPPDYSGRPHAGHTAHNAPFFTRPKPCITSNLHSTSRRAYMTKVPFFASQHHRGPLDTYSIPIPLSILLHTGHLPVPHSA